MVALVSTAVWVCYAAATPGRLAAGVTNVLGLSLEVRERPRAPRMSSECAPFFHRSRLKSNKRQLHDFARVLFSLCPVERVAHRSSFAHVCACVDYRSFTAPSFGITAGAKWGCE